MNDYTFALVLAAGLTLALSLEASNLSDDLTQYDDHGEPVGPFPGLYLGTYDVEGFTTTGRPMILTVRVYGTHKTLIRAAFAEASRYGVALKTITRVSR